MLRSIIWATLAALTAALGACDKDTFDHQSSRATDSGAATYPSCLRDLYEYYPGPGRCEGGLFGSGGGDSCAACACPEPCQSDADCAAPAGTTAFGRCLENNCFLDCTGEASCPEGMACTSVDAPFGEICPNGLPCSSEPDRELCMWTVDDPLVCHGGGAATPSADPCEEFTDPSACESLTSINPDLRCGWVEERILATGGGNCEPADVRGRCIALERRSNCDAPGCGPEGPSVYWTDLGAGTTALLVLEDCEWGPMPEQSESRNACDFSGDVGLPLVCECACASDSDGTSADGM